jgi:hypothetical protein
MKCGYVRTTEIPKKIVAESLSGTPPATSLLKNLQIACCGIVAGNLVSTD